MDNKRDIFEDFFFFLLKVIVVALVSVSLYLLKERYQSKKIDSLTEDIVRLLE